MTQAYNWVKLVYINGEKNEDGFKDDLHYPVDVSGCSFFLLCLKGVIKLALVEGQSIHWNQNHRSRKYAVRVILKSLKMVKFIGHRK